MATEEATPKESAKINPAENLEGWLDQRDAERAAKSDQTQKEASPAEPTVAEVSEPAQPSTGAWRKQVLDDVEHGFFKGKPAEELYKSYQHSERAKQDAERRAAEAERRAEQLQRERDADAAARRVAAEKQAPAPPSEDEEIARLWFDNPSLAAQKLRERAAADARKEAAEEAQRVYQQQQQQSYENYVYKTGPEVYKAAQKDLGLTDEEWQLRAPAVYHHFTNQASPFYGDGGNILRKEEIVNLYKRIYPSQAAAPAPPPVVVKPAADEPPPPPGAKKPAAVTQSDTTASPLSREEREARKVIANIAGLDPERFIKRGERRRA